jgi:hypothetical protein
VYSAPVALFGVAFMIPSIAMIIRIRGEVRAA